MVDSTTNTGGNPHLARAYALTGPDDARALYDEWATSYDTDLADEAQGYVAPERAADTVARVAGVSGEILDAGCGTGLVGVALVDRGATTIDGVDLSPGMLARAEVDRLVELGLAELVEADVVPYRAGAGVDARMLVLAVR